MAKRRRKKGGVAFGFVITVGLLFLLTAFLLFNSGPSITSSHVPPKLPAYSGYLRAFAPMDSLQVSFDNLTAIRAVNQSVISNQVFFELDQPHVSFNTTSVGYRLTIGLTKPNTTVTVATLDQAAYRGLNASLFGGQGGVLSQQSGNFTLYAAAGTISNETQAYWFTLIPADRALLFSPGANDAFQALEHVLNVFAGTTPSILDNTGVDRMLYTVNGTEGHLALGIQQFSGTVRTGQATIISVDAVQSSTTISYVVRFADSTNATAEITAVRSAYSLSHQFIQYDELVKAIEVEPISQLRVGIGLVG